MGEASSSAVSATLDTVVSGMEVINYNLVCLITLFCVLVTAVIGLIIASYFKDWFK